MMTTTFRSAEITDAKLLAELVNYAGEGLPLYLWEKISGSQDTAWEVGYQRASREEGGFSYRNATLIEHDGVAAGCLIGYEIADEPEPIPDDIPAMFLPLQELENEAPGTWYVNVLAVIPALRNKGLGSKLLQFADDTGEKLNKRGMSLIVSDANKQAKQLYERHGYTLRAQRPMVKDGWDNAGVNWLLMVKDF